MTEGRERLFDRIIAITLISLAIITVFEAIHTISQAYALRSVAIALTH